MALGAVVAEALSGMIRVTGPVIGGLVTRPAIGWRLAGIISGGMTRAASYGSMSTSQWECGRGVVERRRLPRGGIVASCARLTEVIGHMVRVGSRCKRCLMAAVAIGWGAATVAISMARNAGHGRVSTSQREGGRGVVEGRRLPSSRVVARNACVANAIGNMIGASGGGKHGLVTGVTISWCVAETR